MAELKTKKTGASVEDYLAAIKDAEKQQGARTLLRVMKKVSGEKPKMWGTAIVGFGQYHYRYGSGREADWPLLGFSPRAQALTVYLPAGFRKLQPLLKKLGKHSTGASCLHIKSMSEIDSAVLEKILVQGLVEAKALDRTIDRTRSASKSRTKPAVAASKSTAKGRAAPKGKTAARRARASA